MNATSPDELQYAAWGGGELRDSASRNYNAPFTAPVLRGSSSERPPRRCLRALRLGSLYPNKIRGRRFLKESRYSLSVQADEACGAKSNVSCVPPLREAAGGCGPRDPLGRKSNTSFTAQSCRVRPVAHPPKRQSRWATRPAVRRTALLALGPNSSPKPGQKQSPKHSPHHSPILSPARRENRSRFSRPKNSRSPKHSPVLRPVSASLRLRYRSAGAARHSKAGRIYS